MHQPVTLGVLAPFVGGVYLAEVMAQLYHAVETQGARVIAIRTGGLGRFDLPIAWDHVDGWLIVLNAVSAEYLASLRETNKPIVSIAYDFQDPRIVTVASDNEGSTAEVTRELLEHGHRNIAYVGYVTEYDIKRRVDGYRRALNEYGIEYRPEYVFDTQDYGTVGGIRAAREILRRRLPVSAALAGTDRNALGVITCFQEASLRIPEDIAVVGYDNTTIARSSVPPLASVDQNIDQLAERAVGVVLEQIRTGNSRGGRELVRNTFIRRSSCGLSGAQEHVDQRYETREMVADDAETTVVGINYELTKDLIGTSTEPGAASRQMNSLMKLLIRYLDWGCISRWPDPTNEPERLVVRCVYSAGRDEPEMADVNCTLTEFPPLSTLTKRPEFAAAHFICVLPIITESKRWGVLAVSGPIARTGSRRSAGIMHYIEMLAPAFVRSALDEDLAEYQAGLEELVRQRTQELSQKTEELTHKTAELMVLNERAESANRAKSSFLASMSHELRTPLNAILGYAQVLRRDSGLSLRQITGLDTIRVSGEHLLMLINDILDLSRIEAGKVEIFPATLNLPAFMRIIADIVRVKAEQKSLLFRYEASPNLPQAVTADEKRLRQVLLNLVGNAIKFTERGEVSLRASTVGESAGQARIRFEVQDTGIGIDESERDRLFRPFEQAPDVQRRFGGTGLGLSISRELVRLMGGDISVTSQPGAGSLFWFELALPVVAASLDQAALDQTIIGYEGERKKILVVDDVLPNRAVVLDLLNSLGFDTFDSSDGSEAILLAQKLSPDLIIMDNVMPVMSGLEATRRLRALAEFHKLPIIIMSASASASDYAQSLDAGANAFLAKPLDFHALLRQVGDLLHLKFRYESDDETSTSSPAIFVVPPADEMQRLYELANMGNMRDVRIQASRLETLDPRYRPFADKLRQLAEAYQSKALLDFVRAHT